MRLAKAARPLLAPAVAILVAAAVGVGAHNFGAAHLALRTLARDGEAWRTFAGLHLALALAAFIAVYAAALFCFVPIALILTFASGFLFWPPVGAAASVAGACLGASLSYAAARFGPASGSRGGRSPGWRRAERLLDGLRTRVFRVTLSVRLLPLTPFTLFSLAAGGMRAAFWPFLAGTALGVLPECIAYALLGRRLGAALSAGQTIQVGDIVRPGLLIPLVILAAVGFASLFLSTRDEPEGASSRP